MSESASDERLLWIHVLLQACAEYQEPVRSERDLRERRELMKWFRNPDTGSTGAFGWICLLLDLDPKRTWRRIKERSRYVDFGEILESVRRCKCAPIGSEVAA
jgi:hypothetical protein